MSMKNTMDHQNNINTQRRSILKQLAVFSTASAAFGFSYQAISSESSQCGIQGNEEPEFLPVPQHNPPVEGMFKVSPEQDLYYWDTGGSGPVIVLIHPGRGSAFSWPYQQTTFADAGFRTIAYSRRGHQGSPITSAVNSSTDADDLNDLLTFLKVDKFHAVALAAGGFTLSDFAVSFSDKLLSMTIVCSLFGLWDKDIDARSDFILSKGFSDLPPEFKELGAAYRFAHPEGVEAWKKMEQKAKEKGLRNRQKDKNKVTWEKLRALKIPTFMITGGADLYQPPSMMRAAARQLPGTKTLVVPEAGHALQWEQPTLFNKKTLNFIRSLTR